MPRNFRVLLCSAWLAAAQAKAQAQIPTEIGFVQNCYYQSTSTTVGYTLEMEYQVLDQNGQPIRGVGTLNSLGVVITESITTKTGPTIVGGSSWCPVGGNCSAPGSMNPNGTFWDTLAASATGGPSTINQSFSLNGVVLPVVNLPGIPASVNTTVLPGQLSRSSVTVDGITSSTPCSSIKGPNGPPAP
jgi:hypothetical protein